VRNTRPPAPLETRLPTGPADAAGRGGVASARPSDHGPALEQSVPARFEQQVAQHPGRVAIEAGDRALTYDALNRAADRVARALVAARGPSPEPIALLFDRGARAIIAVLGTLKAGKIVVPLNASDPHARTAGILRHSRAAAIVTEAALLTRARELGADALPVLDAGEAEAGGSSDNLRRSIAPDAVARIVYTSGSTGRPKGVAHTHRATLHSAVAYADVTGLGPADRMILLASHSQAAGLLDVFRALLSGATVVPFDVRARGLAALADALRRDRITVYHSTPMVFRALAESLPHTVRFPSLRLIHLGGEAVSRRDVELYRRVTEASCVLLHALASTETGLYRQLVIDRETPIDGVLVPAGHPVPGMAVRLLDDSGREVATGGVGEIAVQSRYLASGYWREPALTRQVFSFAPDGSGERIYRTGDLGSMLPDGCLVCLGRKDSQVKIRGYRVEPAEVEAALREHPHVKDVAVAGRAHPASGDTRLVAYVVPREPLRSDDLRRFLGAALPTYTVPSVFVLLDALPLLPGGKLDRGALPEPVWEQGSPERASVAPTRRVEQQVAELWETILGIRPVGLRDNFFDLGGDSLTAMRILNQVERTWGTRLPLAAFLEEATVEHLARLLWRSAPASSTPPVPGGTPDDPPAQEQ